MEDSCVLLPCAHPSLLAKGAARKSWQVNGVLASHTQRLLLSPASVWGLGAQLPVLERMLPAPLPLPEACHSKAWVRAKGQLQASQKPHPCLAHAHLLGVQPQAEGGRGRGRGVLAQGWSF